MRSSKERPNTIHSMGNTRQSAFFLLSVSLSLVKYIFRIHNSPLFFRRPVLLRMDIAIRWRYIRGLLDAIDIILLVHCTKLKSCKNADIDCDSQDRPAITYQLQHNIISAIRPSYSRKSWTDQASEASRNKNTMLQVVRLCLVLLCTPDAKSWGPMILALPSMSRGLRVDEVSARLAHVIA